MWFKRLIEEIALWGLGANISCNDPLFDRNKLRAEFYKLVPLTHIFIIDIGNEIKQEKIDPAQTHELLELDLPFTTCAFEAPQGRCLFSDRGPNKEATGQMLCLVAHEYSPRVYRFWSLEYDLTRDAFTISCWYEDQSVIEAGNLSITSRLNLILSDLQRGQIVSEKIKEKVRIGTGKERKPHIISEVIRIVPKNLKEIKPCLGGKLDFTHRFEVRGHWRHIKGIGKDRAGDYGVKGFTWVIPHTKGPENLPLIKKTRIVVN